MSPNLQDVDDMIADLDNDPTFSSQKMPTPDLTPPTQKKIESPPKTLFAPMNDHKRNVVQLDELDNLDDLLEEFEGGSDDDIDDWLNPG